MQNYTNKMENPEETLGSSMMSTRYKIVLVGDFGVGKTAILHRFMNAEFSDAYDVNKKNFIM